jgi:hypothetical protein
MIGSVGKSQGRVDTDERSERHALDAKRFDRSARNERRFRGLLVGLRRRLFPRLVGIGESRHGQALPAQISRNLELGQRSPVDSRQISASRAGSGIRGGGRGREEHPEHGHGRALERQGERKSGRAR